MEREKWWDLSPAKSEGRKIREGDLTFCGEKDRLRDGQPRLLRNLDL